MSDTKVNIAQRHADALKSYIVDEMPSKRGVYKTTRRRLYALLDTLKDATLYLRGYLGEQIESVPESASGLTLWISQSDAMPPFKPKTPVSVTVEILTSDNKVVKAIYDARVSIWLSAEEWYKPEQVVGWRRLADG